MGESAKAGEPGNAALHDPAFGQQDEAAFVGWALDQNKVDALRGGVRDGLLARAAFISEGDFNLTARDPLHPFGQFRNLRTNGTSPQASCSLAGVRYAANKWPSVSTARCTMYPAPTLLIKDRRKTPCFSNGDTRRLREAQNGVTTECDVFGCLARVKAADKRVHPNVLIHFWLMGYTVRWDISALPERQSDAGQPAQLC